MRFITLLKKRINPTILKDMKKIAFLIFDILERILFIIVYAATLPLIILCCFISALPMPVIALFIYIAKGDKEDTLIDFIQAPVVWAVDLPYKIMGYE